MILYISGSFPNLGDGIGDAVGHLYDELIKQDEIRLITTKHPDIIKYIHQKGYNQVDLVKNWKLRTLFHISRRIIKENVTHVLLEYCGNGYRKDFSISLLPLVIRIRNIFKKDKVFCYLRLHEYSMCSLPRKMFTYLIVRFCNGIETPSYIEYKILSKKFGKKVKKSRIGSNIVGETEELDRSELEQSNKPVVLGFFGGIYPGKGIETLLDVWAALERKYPNKYKFCFIGGIPKGLTTAFDSYQKVVMSKIKEYGLKDKISFSGYLPEQELKSWLNNVDIAVLPYEDGLTLRRSSFVSFLTQGVAIVTSGGDDEAMQVFNNSAGVKMCRTTEEMIAGIEYFSENKKYVLCGRDNLKYKDYFDWSTIASNTINEIYNHL